MKKAVAIRHVPFEDLGNLEPALSLRGFQTTFREAGLDDLSATDIASADLLIILGGPIGVYESRAYPFLTDEIKLIEHRLASDLPTLGICLGAQLMAAALGSRVYPGDHGKEIGWSALQRGAAGNHHPFFNPLFDEGVEVLHWHGDTFDLPEGAAHLASSSQYPNQAFALGRSALALQCHAEVTAAGLERWYIGHASELGHAGLDVVELRTQGKAKAEALSRAAEQFWASWLEDLD
jgi:GMP synthase (glutamine-hydrolysing)